MLILLRCTQCMRILLDINTGLSLHMCGLHSITSQCHSINTTSMQYNNAVVFNMCYVIVAANNVAFVIILLLAFKERLC